MRRLCTTMVVLGAPLGAVGLAGLVQTGCGDDSSTAAMHAGADASTDHELDAGGGTRIEAGGDSTEEAALDAGGAEASVGLVFATHQATAICRALLNCCPGGLDSGTYDLESCIETTSTSGWEGTLPEDAEVYSRGHVTVDQTKASRCISALDAFPCGMQTAAQWGAITSACELVLEGTIPSNSPGCISSFECAPGNYCDPTVDGGLCTPLAKQGQPCNTKINDPTLARNPLADQMCSYLSAGESGLFCDLINNGPDAATCEPLLANGASCTNATNGYYDDQACKAPALCGDDQQCGGTATYPYSGYCQYFGNRDAGGPA